MQENPKPEPSNGNRLDSWKEIAAYLKQGVRTAQRWEREENLPVHRPPGKKRGTVYAFPQDLDAWFRTRASETHQAESPRRDVKLLWLAAASALLAVSALLLRDPAPKNDASVRTEQLVDTVAPGWGRISPDGSQLAYRADEDRLLYLRDMRTGASRVLVESPVHTQFVWSQDGRTIAYTAQRGRDFRLETVDVKSGRSSVLRTGASVDEARTAIGWDSTRRSLLCGTTDFGRYERLSIRDGRSDSTLELEGQILDPALAPDGRALAYTRRNGRFHDIEVKLLDSDAEPILVTAFEESERYPVWSPDGRTILFTRIYDLSTSSKSEFWAVSFDPEAGSVSGEPLLVGPATHLFREIPAVLTDDGALYWAQREPSSRAQVLEVDPRSGAPLDVRTDFPAGSAAKHWAPNKHSTLYFWDPEVRWQVLSEVLAFRERDLDNGRERIYQAPWPKLSWKNFAYRDDLTEAVFGVQEGKLQTLYHYVVATDQATKVLTSERNLVGVLANGGGRIAFVKGRPSDPDVSVGVLDLDTKAVRMLYEGREMGLFAWSPDDEEIAFSDHGCLLSVTVQSGDISEISCAPQGAREVDAGQSSRIRYVGAPAWSPDGRMLAWATINPDQERFELWVVNRNTGDKRVVWQADEGYETRAASPSWSPNGRFIAFTLVSKPPLKIWAIRDPLLAPGVS